MDPCLRGVSRNVARVRFFRDLEYESWFKKVESLVKYDCEICMILRSLVLTHYQRVTDRQTDTPPVALSRSSTDERDKKD